MTSRNISKLNRRYSLMTFPQPPDFWDKQGHTFSTTFIWTVEFSEIFSLSHTTHTVKRSLISPFIATVVLASWYRDFILLTKYGGSLKASRVFHRYLCVILSYTFSWSNAIIAPFIPIVSAYVIITVVSLMWSKMDLPTQTPPPKTALTTDISPQKWEDWTHICAPLCSPFQSLAQPMKSTTKSTQCMSASLPPARRSWKRRAMHLASTPSGGWKNVESK